MNVPKRRPCEIIGKMNLFFKEFKLLFEKYYDFLP